MAITIGNQDLMLQMFETSPIRSTFHNGRWFYSLVDVIAAITDTPHPSRYLSDFRSRLDMEGSEIYANCVKLSLPREDGSLRKQLCADTFTLLRIIQSVPSPKAEPFKMWLAQVAEASLVDDSEEERARRIDARRRFHMVSIELTELVKTRGVLTKQHMQAFREARYQGLYGLDYLEMLNRAGGLFPGDEPEATMGAEELIDNLFVEAQTRSYAVKHDIIGAQALIEKHEDIALETRLTIERIGGTLPENLPRHRRLEHCDFLIEEKGADSE